ncbi:MAG TPA: alpha-(1-_3)-arabinofuranosyltransferase family protein [Solirubrobacteraceae bacterium]|nr:alpha-(1->3)-arabinofuranosyltransferase family protein [Solirubrobacteraceae bacterium]
MTALRARTGRPRASRDAAALAGRARDRLMVLGMTLASFALAFGQAPGAATADTKVDLHIDPGSFLSSVASAWSASTDLGEVHSAQYSGYLWPMGPFFAALHAIGIGPWVVERLWLGVLFALSAWGMVRLMDTLIGRPRGVAHLVAAAFYVLNPYTVIFTARTSLTLIGYAALPWLMIITYHGLRATRGWRGWRSWWWAAAFALVLTSTGGGVNAAVVGWMLVGPLVLALYEPAVGTVRWRDAFGFLVRAGTLGLLASLWWIVPVLVHVHYGINFLQYTEQPPTIWGTNSLTEVLRLMGYWTSYLGVGFGGVIRPFSTVSSTMLFDPVVIAASLLVPALAVAGFVRARRTSYGPLLMLVALVGVLIEVAGFPDGTPVRGTMVWIYEHIFVLSFMRTTNKAAPLVALGVAGLFGLGVRSVLVWARGRRSPSRRRAALIAISVAVAALIGFASLPLVRGSAIDTQLTFKAIPRAWRDVGQDLNRDLPANRRAIVLPGQIFAYYRWGGTLDAVLPRLTTKPVAVRFETPYSDLHADDMLDTVDDLVQQNRLVPGELRPLLQLLSVGSVVTGTDDDISRSGATDPASAAATLAGQGFGTPVKAYGNPTRHPAAAGDLTPGPVLPEVRRYSVSESRGLIRVEPTGPATVVDGAALTLADLAAFGTLPSQTPILYAGDQTSSGLRSLARAGADLVVGDSNRRQVYVPQSTQQNRGAVLAQTATLPVDSAGVDPFTARGSAAQTVSALQGARYVQTPSSYGELQFPETAPIAAFDGDPQTAWIADRTAPVADRWIQIGFDAPRAVPYVDILPFNDAHQTVTEVDVNGIAHRVGRGWTRVPVNLHGVSAIRVTIDALIKPRHGDAGAGGLREVRIPGVHLRNWLRAPVLVGRDLAGMNLSHDSLTYLLDRQTGDDPFRRSLNGPNSLLDQLSARGDAEPVLQRILFTPQARRYRVGAWVYPAVSAPDSALDALAGDRSGPRFDSSGRYQNQPAWRASSAFGTGAGPGWVGVYDPGEVPAPWIGWSTARPRAVSGLRLTPSMLPVRTPQRVVVSWPGGHTAPLPVGSGGTVALGRTVRARRFRITITAAAFPAGLTARRREAPAVGIGHVTVPGLAAPRLPTSGPLNAPCGTIAFTIDGRRIPMLPQGTVQALDAGQPMLARGCGPAAGAVAMGAGVQHVAALPGTFSIDSLRLASPAPTPVRAPVSGGRVVNPGSIGESEVSGTRVSLRGRSWIVLGESWDAGWTATCNGRSLGAPQVIDGYANGWLAPASCTHVAIAFGPQSGIEHSYLAAIIAVALMVLLIAFGLTRRASLITGPGRSPGAADAETATEIPGRPWLRRPSLRALPRALGIALVVAIPLGYWFALRAGAALFVLVALVIWLALDNRTLILLAAGLLGIVVPAIYLLATPADKGGYNFAYSVQLIWAHWVGVAAIVLLCLVLLRIIRARRVR